MSGVLCEPEVKPKCPLCGSERHVTSIAIFSAHSTTFGLMYQVAWEMLLKERQASWQSVWDDLAAMPGLNNDQFVEAKEQAPDA